MPAADQPGIGGNAPGRPGCRVGRRMQRTHERRNAVGATLAELMVVLGISAVVLAVAGPDLHALVTAQQMRTASGELLGAIAHTRAQAIARNGQVKLMPRDPLGADWTQGWTIFVDRDGDREPSAADEILSVHGPLDPGLRVDFSFTQSAPPQYIAYNGAGRSCSDTNANSSRLGTLSLFHGEHVRRIKINMLGRVRMCNPERDEGCEGAQAPQ